MKNSSCNLYFINDNQVVPSLRYLMNCSASLILTNPLRVTDLENTRRTFKILPFNS